MKRESKTFRGFPALARTHLCRRFFLFPHLSWQAWATPVLNPRISGLKLFCYFYSSFFADFWPRTQLIFFQKDFPLHGLLCENNCSVKNIHFIRTSLIRQVPSPVLHCSTSRLLTANTNEVCLYNTDSLESVGAWKKIVRKLNFTRKILKLLEILLFKICFF